MQPGDRYNVYYTQLVGNKPQSFVEGVVTLIQETGLTPHSDGSEFWTVEFYDEPGNYYQRWVHPDNKVDGE